MNILVLQNIERKIYITNIHIIILHSVFSVTNQ